MDNRPLSEIVAEIKRGGLPLDKYQASMPRLGAYADDDPEAHQAQKKRGSEKKRKKSRKG